MAATVLTGLTGLTGLVVHPDDMGVADDVRGALERLGYRVADTAASGRQDAPAAAELLQPDVVVIDGRHRPDPTMPPLAPPTSAPSAPAGLAPPAVPDGRNRFKIPVVFLAPRALRAGTRLAPETRTEEAGERDERGERGEPVPCAALFEPPDDHNLRAALELAHALAAQDAERRRLEQRLAQSERLASIGTMAAGMAHEINNPLSYVIANVGLVVEGLLEAIAALAGGDPATAAQLRELVDALREANEGAERVRRIVLDLKKFARVERASLAVVDVTEALDAAIRDTARAMRLSAPHARFRKHYGPTPLVEAGEGQLGQLFANILANAAEAVAACDPGHQEIAVTTRTDSLGRAVVEVHDRGPGIPPETLPRIFDPFFTGKTVGARLGLGLAICKNVVSALGGQIAAESSREAGTTLRVVLPPTRSSGARTRAAPPQPAAGRRGRVLVVDDETAVANSVARMLRVQHEVVVETDPRRALSRLLGGEGYDVVFCDLTMPGMSGIDLYRALVTAAPEQAKRVVFMTGGAHSPHAQAFLESVGNVSVAKPFAIQTIRAIVGDYVK